LRARNTEVEALEILLVLKIFWPPDNIERVTEGFLEK
jgi:hypothetical protein